MGNRRIAARMAASSRYSATRTAARRIFLACLLLPLLGSIFATAWADTVSYEYDSLGRLKKVTSSNGSVIDYTLDPAGNRTGVSSGTPPGVPASITVPSSSSTGSYTINWGVASGTLTAYQLYEATNSGFSGETLAYSGTALSKAISGKGNGTYYYRVRACYASMCSAYRTGANPTVVSLGVPAPPATISGPSMNTTGNFSISWSSSTGATRYELWESVFGGAFSKVHDGTATSKSFTNKPNGEYEYKAKACNAVGCSGYSPTKFVQVCVGGCSFAAPPPEE
jgi:YD repeat-containing protein